MRREILIPQLGLMEAATIVEWLRQPGDRVAKDEPIVVIETDKANAEIVAPAEGVLEIAVPSGPDPVAVDVVLGYVDDGAGPA